MSKVVYLNGSFVDYAEAVVPVEDRGFLFADGVYEAVRFYGRKPFALEEHLARLRRSAEAIKLGGLPSTQELMDAALETVARNECLDAVLYLQVTRGSAPRKHEFPASHTPSTVFMIAREVPRPGAQRVSHGVPCITVSDIRWHRCDIKSIALLPNVLAKQQAAEAGAAEAIFVRDGTVTEGGSSNFFIVSGECLYTHPANEHILAGITRSHVLSLARELQIEVREETFGLSEVEAADEAFITSTGIEVLPVTTIDGKPVGTGVPGPVTKRLWQAFDGCISRL